MTILVAKEQPQDLKLPGEEDRFAGIGDRDSSLPKRGKAASWAGMAKVLTSLALLVILGLSVDMGQILDILTHAAPLPFIAAILAFSIQCGIAALRCRAVIGPSWRIPVADHVRIFWIGQFFNQLLPSTIGGDAMRALLLSRLGPRLATAIKLTLVDRLTGVIALMLVMILLASLPKASMPLIGEASRALGGVAVIGVSGLVLALLITQQKPIARHLKNARLLKPLVALLDELALLIRSPSKAAQVFALALLVHGCSILAFWFAALSIGETLGLIEAAVIVPPMLLIAMMPISVAGWGVREGVVLVGLRIQGVSAEASISIALLFGLALLIASLPGSLLWLTRRSEQPAPKSWRT